uniref:VM domain-containing protein n=1 Tax=Glossina austeni TaxID=7395 RepID=A0A1A9UXD6_GLOAU
MQTIVVFLLTIATIFVAAVQANVVAVGTGVGSQAAGMVGAPVIQAPPCPKNYMFTCQPHMAPVPCSQSASVNYGPVGAYSESIPTIIAVPYAAAASYPNAYQRYFINLSSAEKGWYSCYGRLVSRYCEKSENAKQQQQQQ